MHILLIKDGMQIGGTTTSFVNLLIQLKEVGSLKIDVWINDFKKNMATQIPAYCNVIQSNELRIAFSQPQTLMGKLFDSIRSCTLFDIAAIRCSGHNITRMMSAQQRITLKRAKKKQKIDLLAYDVVITWEEFFSCYYLAYCVSAKRKIAWIHPDYKQSGMRSEVDFPVFKHLDGIVAVSESGKRTLQSEFPMYKDKFYAVPNCVDTQRIRDLAQQRPKDMPLSTKVTLVTVARIQNISKAFDRALRVAAQLKANSNAFHWYFIGDGEDLEAMRNISIQMQLSECVTFLGSRINPYGYMKYADLFVLQSYYEGRPMVVDEALTVGTPVLVSKYEAAEEQVPDTVGWVVENDEESIYKAIEGILKEPACLKEKQRAIGALPDVEYEKLQKFLQVLECERP